MAFAQVPHQILSTSIVLGHWGGQKGFSVAKSDCVDPNKDIVVPPITPIQHDLETYRTKLQPYVREVDAHSSTQRNGTLLLFAGGVLSFGASQDRMRESGVDSAAKQARLEEQTSKDKCADPLTTLPKYAGKNTHTVKRCRDSYSMGVRSAVWKARLFAQRDMRLVSAGIPNYLGAARDAHFCLHTEGNSWGTRLIDQLAVECIPLIVNDGMVCAPHAPPMAHTLCPRFPPWLCALHIVARVHYDCVAQVFPFHNIIAMQTEPSDAGAIANGSLAAMVEARSTSGGGGSEDEGGDDGEGGGGYPSFSLHLSKEDVPRIPTLLRAVPEDTRQRLRRGLRVYKRGFIWFRPEGLAYEYTLAALGERLVSYLGHSPNVTHPAAGRGRGRGRGRAAHGPRAGRCSGPFCGEWL